MLKNPLQKLKNKKKNMNNELFVVFKPYLLNVVKIDTISLIIIQGLRETKQIYCLTDDD